MEMRSGMTRFGLWFVRVDWSGNRVYRVSFLKSGKEAPVPIPIRQYLSGRATTIEGLESVALLEAGAHGAIYREVCNIPYGETATYGEIAERAGTNPRMVGRALAFNPTPLLIPCHRVVSARGIGGFTPDIRIKEALLSMERRVSAKMPDRRG